MNEKRLCLDILLPDDFVDYEWEVTAKGWFGDARLIVPGAQYKLSLCDPVRLIQEVESELECGSVFFEKNLIVIQSVTGLNMRKAIEELAQSGRLASLMPE